jgi:hypothetical protein
VFGLFKPPGKVDFQLDKPAYAFGDTIHAKIKLEVGQPKKARALRVSFLATRVVHYTQEEEDHATHQRRRVSKTRTDIIYTFKTDIDGEREYSGMKEYDVEIKVPAKEQVVPKMPDGILGQIAGVAMAGSLMNSGPIVWKLNVSLDIPMGADVSKQVQVQVG